MASTSGPHNDAPGIAWEPTDAYLRRNALQHLIDAAGARDYPDLLARVAENPARFWSTVLQDLDLAWWKPYESIWDLSRGKARPEWFPGAGFNYVDSALDRHVDGPLRDKTAVIWEGDDGTNRSLTYGELGELTERTANALRSLGVRKGDRVGIFLPMTPETVAATLACGKLGAIYVPLFSGYGVDAIVTRLSGCEATVLITADGFPRRGKTVPMKQTADAAMAQLPAIEHCIVLKRAGNDCDMKEGRDIWWHDIVDTASTERIAERTAASDPFVILYTSGTTGMPKGAVHIHAGFPIKALHDLVYCFDLHADDVLFWYTDLGWMMGPWLIAGGLMRGSTIVLYEGTPDYPDCDRLWEIIERHRVTIFGVAPTAIRALMPHGREPVEKHDLSSLRILGSTGETWNPDPWQWYFEVVGGSRCPIINYSGGTEISGGILGGNTLSPLRSCSFAGPIPGMVADVVDESGQSVRGEVGELVLREPFIGMTNSFWKADQRYLETYWSRFPDTWVHGDYAQVDEDGFWYIRGRSDDTINVAGKRIGPAEIESAAVGHGSVREAAAVAVPHPVKGDTVLVFAIPHTTTPRTESAAEAVRQHIGAHLGGSLRPEKVIFVDDLPRTRNAKIMRRTIRAAWLRTPTGDLSALENPGAIDAIRALNPDS